jgi:hypothetical protein
MFENPTVSCNELCNSYAMIVYFSSEFTVAFLYASRGIQNASE